MIDMNHVEAVIAAGPYEPTWRSLSRIAVPGWFADAKFGIFTHWGLYTVPEFRNEWYSRNMYIQGYPEFDHHVATYGPQKEFGYKDFIPMFTAERFDADEWLDLFAASGARYYFPVAEHHDGFQMYASELSHWNAAEMGPKRDILGELREATLRHDMHFAASNHRAEHWWFMGHGQEFDSDVKEPMQRGDFYWPAHPEPDNQDLFSVPRPDEEYLDDWLLRVCELVDKYRPEMVYFDWWIQHESFKPYIKKFAAYYYNRGVEWGVPVIVCYKDDGMAFGAGLADVERGGFAAPTPFVWQTDTAIARNSWCYTKSLDYKTLPELIITLLDTVSKNGNLLLNVGPRADGAIAEHDRELLLGIGAWLDANGEGIYDTRPWRVNGEGPTQAGSGSFADQTVINWTAEDWRFTAANGNIYAFCLNPADAQTLKLTSFHAYHDGQRAQFHGIITGVEQLGAGPVAWHRADDALEITPAARPGVAPDVPIGFTIRVA
ncbi:alpha-L-fucosidase [Bifidobacterium oedipodis]|uniref:alpha-L-fucosidase n=1 Tax=Bifidobacterium oedipodis TaxID=2675322 RepID=A0A7Y0HTB7_9BIFI|nr:alpha-L-fucosidase [Bifidobacterium sp. DSM 109957]NMM94921.1 alpha-L-fucosidase [Bifidobacterium sp. DSM 109957]